MKPEEMSVFPVGEPNDAYAKYFVGQSYLNMLSTEQVRNGRNFDTCCLLRRMAKGMGSIPYGKRSLGG